MRDQLPPPVLKIVLGRELERQRRLAGLTQEEASAALGCTQQKIGYVEGGGGVKPVELGALLDHYGAADHDRAYALDLHAEGNHRAKRGVFRSRFHQYMRLLVDMEPTCHQYFTYMAVVVPGLLQTEDYMRTLFRAWRPSPPSDQVEQDTQNRLARQQILDNSDQQFWFVIDEAALHRTAGNPEIMKGQITRLIEIIDRPNVELQIVPFSAGYYMAQSCEYTIFRYSTRSPVDIVFLEQYDGGEYVNDPKRTASYLALWEQHKAAAIGPEQSRRYLLNLASSS